jgi:hypothetical protein
VIGWERVKISQRDAGRESKWARIGMIYRIDVPARIVLLALKRSRTGAKCVKGACESFAGYGNNHPDFIWSGSILFFRKSQLQFHFGKPEPYW